MGEGQEVENQGLRGRPREDKQVPQQHVGRKGASGPDVTPPIILNRTFIIL